MPFQFSSQAWDEYLIWQTTDKRIVKKINDLLQDIIRGGHNGIGKPEPLKGELSGYWSRRIDDRNRLVYKVENETFFILQCKGHYDVKMNFSLVRSKYLIQFFIYFLPVPTQYFLWEKRK